MRQTRAPTDRLALPPLIAEQPHVTVSPTPTYSAFLLVGIAVVKPPFFRQAAHLVDSELQRPAPRHGVPESSAEATTEAGDGGAGRGDRDGLGAVCVLVGGGAVPGSLGPDARPSHRAAGGRGGRGDRLGPRSGADGRAAGPAPTRGAAGVGGGGLGRRGDPGPGPRALAAADAAGREPGAPGPRRGGRGERRVPPCGPRCGRPGREAGSCPGGGAGGRTQRAPGARGPLRAGRAPGHRGRLSPAAGHPRCAGYRARAGPGTEGLARPHVPI